MTDFNTPLKDIEQAKAYFQSMGCSHFYMSREYQGRYDEYRSMNIAKSLEREWTRESIATWNDQILDQKTNEADLWWMHSRMADLARNLQTNEAVEFVHSATLNIMYRLQSKSCLLVAESIIGRQPVKGNSMIFLAYNQGLKAIARDLSGIALKLIDRAIQSGYDTVRCNKALIECNRIVKILKI